MNITELKREELNLHLNVKIPSDIIESAIKKELADLSKTAKIAGFRPGKIPLNIIEKKYGHNVRSNILNNKLQSSIDNIIKDQKLNVVGQPVVNDIKMEPSQDLEFDVQFELIPPIEMIDFKQISITKPVLEIAPSDIEEKLGQLLDISKKYEKESKKAASKGDQVVIDAVGEIDGTPFEGGKLDSYKLVLGSGVFIPGFEDQLVGCKVGEEKVVKVDFPADYHANDLAGKPADFKVKVLKVFKSEPPELNEEFAKQYNCKTVDELKEKLGKLIESQYKEPILTIMKLHLFDSLENMLSFDVPPSLLKKELDLLQSNSEEAKKSDPTLAQKSDEELESYYKKIATRRVRIGLMLAEYAKINDIQINFDEIKQAVMEQARHYPGNEAAIYEYYKKNPAALSSLQGPLLENKTVNIIFEKEVNLIEKKYSKKELEDFLEKENAREIE